MAKVFTSMLMELNTKDNLKMTKWMAKVFNTLLMELNTKDNLKMAK